MSICCLGKRGLRKLLALVTAVSLFLAINVNALAEEVPAVGPGEVVEIINYEDSCPKNEGTINTLSGELGENYGTVGTVSPKEGDNWDSPVGKIDINYETGYVSKLDGEINVNGGYINELNGTAEYNLGYIKSKTNKSDGLWENYGIIESDDGNNPYCSIGGPTHMNAGVILEEKNVVCANYGVLNMNGGYGISYNGICHPEALEYYALQDVLENSQGIVISNTDHFIIQNGSDNGIFIFREGTTFTDSVALMDLEAREEGGAYKDNYYQFFNGYLFDDWSYFNNSTFIALDENHDNDLGLIVEAMNEICSPEESNKFIQGAALYETSKGSLGANWVGKNTSNNLANDDAKNYLAQMWQAYGRNMEDFQIIGYVNVPYGTAISSLTSDELGILTEDDAKKAGYSILNDNTALEAGVTYHLYYVLKNKNGKIIVTPVTEPQYSASPKEESTQAVTTQSAPIITAETTLPLSNYVNTVKGYVPFIKDDINTAGWNTIAATMEANKNGTLAITMNGSTTVDNALLAEAAYRNTNLVFELDNSVEITTAPDAMKEMLTNSEEPFLKVSAINYAQGINSAARKCGFSHEELISVGATDSTPVVKVLTSNKDMNQKVKISFDALAAGIKVGDEAYLYGGIEGNMIYAGKAIVGQNGKVVFEVPMLNGYWTIGKIKKDN